MKRRVGAVVVVAGLLVGACASGGNDAEGASADSETSRTSTTAPSTTTTVAPTTVTATVSSGDGADDGDSVEVQASVATVDTRDVSALDSAAATEVSLLPVARGDEGDEVLALQERLREVGFGVGTPDGDYGRRTSAAVEGFQTLMGIEPTGEADAATVVALAGFTYDGLVLHAGDTGADVEQLQDRLAGGPFDPGTVDGEYGLTTVQAVWALEKLAGLPVDGDWGPLDEQAWEQLTAGDIGTPSHEHEVRWVEVDLSEQLAKVYDPGSNTPTLVVHVSSGSGIPWSNEDHSGSSVTPKGEFHINRRISGWRESSLNIGRLYNPLYFNGGIAFHGALSVPLHPASHGCVRVPMHIAEYLPEELPDGTPVHVLA
ncbi:MAG: peptidoglycan-binding protein [Actinomycetota bacterium]